jgi:putative spermidine/putrescine transport system permease protein
VSSRLSAGSGWLLYGFTGAVMVFMLAPLVVIVAMSVSAAPFASFPPRGFTLAWYGTVLQDREFLQSVGLSTGLALAATAGALLLGVPAAYALVRHDMPGRSAARALLLSPLIFPVLVTGVALLRLFSTWQSSNTVLNLLLAHVLVTTPYVVRTVWASLLMSDPALEDAARTLGAGPWRVFRRVTLPMIAPGVMAGALFAFMISFDNYPVSMWLADARVVPLPMLVYRMAGSVFTPAVPAISALMILLAMVVVIAMERLVGLRRAVSM